MAKLYPPYINGTIPAFYCAKGTTKTSIVVPFTMNRAVAAGEVAGFALKIKTINGDVKDVLYNYNTTLITTSNASVTFSTSSTFLVGQYYKVQLAYIDSAGVIGYYSTVGIIKCTTKPVVQIEGLTFGQANTHNYSYTGTYSQKGGDVTEKMYSYRFVLYDADDNIIADSGEKLHNTSLDNISYESHEDFLISQDLDLNHSYYIQFSVTTTNLLTIKSLKYRVIQRRSVSPDLTLNLIAGLNFNHGYIKLSMTDKNNGIISGTFLISRASNKDGNNWQEIKRLDLHSVTTSSWEYRDFTVEQGISYKYSIQQYNDLGIYSDRIISNTVLMDFEDMFLYDGEKQLRVRFNPKVSTFKTDLLENKTDTIGSQFPFFSKNGNVNYKEFTLSGLISYLSDDEENFTAMKEIGLDGYRNISTPYGKYGTTNIVDYNIAAERKFKNEVLDWLNNGQPKLFRTPTEGNYIVRLMNVSLSPNDSLSRMLHTFSATAYEIAECTSEQMTYYGFIDPQETLQSQMRWVTVEIKELVNNYLTKTKKELNQAIGETIQLISRDTISIDFVDMVPGAHIVIADEDIQIGVTGAYHFNTGNYDNVLTDVQYVIDSINEGQLTYGYLSKSVSIFGLIQNINTVDVPAHQFIGTNYESRQWDSTSDTFIDSNDIFDYLNDVRTTVLYTGFLKAEKRPVEHLYIDNLYGYLKEDFLNGENITFQNNTLFIHNISCPCYTDMYCKELFDWSMADPLALYRIRFKADTSPYDTIEGYRYYVDANLNQFSELTDVCIDGDRKKVIMYTDDIFTITVNQEDIDLTEIEKYELKNSEVSITALIPRDGVITEIGYSKQIKIFNFEDQIYIYPVLYTKRKAYLNEENKMIAYRISGLNEDGQAGTYNTQTLKEKYTEYLVALNQTIEQYKEENGLVE